MKQDGGFMEEVKADTIIPKNAILYFNNDSCSLCYTEKDVMKNIDSKVVPVYKVDASQRPDLVKKYQVISAPSAVFIKNGEKVDQFNKYLDRKQLQIIFNYYFGGISND